MALVQAREDIAAAKTGEFSDTDLQGCGLCPHYDPCGPHDRSPDKAVYIRCMKDRSPGLTEVSESVEECPHANATVVNIFS